MNHLNKSFKAPSWLLNEKDQYIGIWSPPCREAENYQNRIFVATNFQKNTISNNDNVLLTSSEAREIANALLEAAYSLDKISERRNGKERRKS